jgi:hypothetical protein
VREFVAANPQHVLPLDEGGMGFLSDDGGETYNGCHCKFFWFLSMVFLFLCGGSETRQAGFVVLLDGDGSARALSKGRAAGSEVGMGRCH